MMISRLLSGVAYRYSIVRRSRSWAIVPAARAGPINRTAISCMTPKVPKKAAVNCAMAFMSP